MHQKLIEGVRIRRSTPNLLLAAGVAVLGAALLAGVLGWQGLARRADALERARAETAQQVRIQTARTSLVTADTAAGNDVLTGADPGQFRYRLFEYRVQPATIGLVTAARTNADAATLATANTFLTRYVMEVAQARTLARQGQDEDATRTLVTASARLHAEVLPRLESVQTASRERLADDEAAADTAPVIALLVGIVAILALIAVHLWLTRRTHRLLNLGLVAGVLVLIGATVAGAAVVTTSRERVRQAQDHALHVADAVVEARFSAFDARSAEALGALDDSTVEKEKTWAARIGDAETSLRTAAHGEPAAVRRDVEDVAGKLTYYTEVHGRLLEQAERGNTARVRQMASNPAPGGVVGSFESFDAYSGALLARQVQTADDAWAAAGDNLRLVGRLTLAVGLLAAALGWTGVAARRREYR